jgi:hypothetical protein
VTRRPSPIELHPELRGRGPAKGAPNAGRPPDEFKAFMRSLVSRDEVSEALGRVLGNPNHPQYVQAYKMAAEFGYGRASQAVQLTGENGAAMELRVVHEVVDPTPPDAA